MRTFPRVRYSLAHPPVMLLVASLVVTGCESAAPTSAIPTESIHGSARATIADPALLAVAGARIFNDPALSLKQNQSCASCHDMQFGFTSPNTTVNANGAVMFGSIDTRFGSRKPPSAAYATQSPVRFYDPIDDTYVGGNFWDGRATGARLGSPAAEQAQLPFVNSVEQALPDVACVIYRVSKASYVDTYVGAYDARIKSIVWPRNTNELCRIEGSTIPLEPAARAIINLELDRIALAIAAFEASPSVNAFSSKYDLWLAKKATLSPREEEGRRLYEGQAGCAGCHPNAGDAALMTDYTYDNIGVPANPKNPALLGNPGFRDLGLGAILKDRTRYGQEKVPTLRNIDRRVGNGAKSYMHNGVFKSIEEVVHFYNTRDVLPDCARTPRPAFGVNCWPAPEVRDNVNRVELGNLGLTPSQEGALVAYLQTLSDGYVRPRSGGASGR